MIIIPLCGALILTIMICFVAKKIHKKLSKFINETKDIPEELVSDRVNLMLFNFKLSAAWPREKKRRFNYDPNRMIWVQLAPWSRCCVL